MALISRRRTFPLGYLVCPDCSQHLCTRYAHSPDPAEGHRREQSDRYTHLIHK